MPESRRERRARNEGWEQHSAHDDYRNDTESETEIEEGYDNEFDGDHRAEGLVGFTISVLMLGIFALGVWISLTLRGDVYSLFWGVGAFSMLGIGFILLIFRPIYEALISIKNYLHYIANITRKQTKGEIANERIHLSWTSLE